MEILNQELLDLIQKQAIEEDDSKGGFCSPLFCGCKGWCSIMNLKHLNSYLNVTHFKMESKMSLRDTIYKGDYMMNIILKGCLSYSNNCPASQKIPTFLIARHGITSSRLFHSGCNGSSHLYQAACSCGNRAQESGSSSSNISMLMASSPDALKNQSQMLIQMLQGLGFILNHKNVYCGQLR